MINEQQVNDVKHEAYQVAIRDGSRAAFALVMELYPEQAENILMQVSVLLEATRHTKLSAGIDKLAKTLN
ncbi:hypothetical protein POP15_160 [Pectobacterium phage POP15]|nr:hypothetical protein POP15_160 [Pectobacterium phage POP15]